LGDSGTATESLAVSVALSLTEGATGAESLSVSATLTLADTASAADRLVVNGGIPLPTPGHIYVGDNSAPSILLLPRSTPAMILKDNKTSRIKNTTRNAPRMGGN
jgi:hypothetical protein